MNRGTTMRDMETGTAGGRSARGLAATATLVLLLVAGAGPVAAQERDAGPERVITLEEAVRTALDRSPELQDARLGAEAAEEQVSEAWGRLYPRVDFSLRYTRNLTPAATFLPAILFDPEAPPDRLTRVQFGADNLWTSSLTFEQPLFEAQAFVGVGAAGRYADLQDEVVRGRVHEVVTRVRTLYYDLLLAREQERLAGNSLRRVRESLEETRALNRAGLAPDYDVLRLEVEVANLEPSLRRAENAYRQGVRELAVELGLDHRSETLEVAGSLAGMELEAEEENSGENRAVLAFMGVEPEAVERDDLIRRARASRSEVRQLRFEGELRQAELRAEQAEFFPRVSLFGNYDIQAQQDGGPSFFGSSDQRGYGRLMGIQVSIPVFTGFQRKARVDRVRAEMRQTETRRELAEERTEAEILGLLDQVDEARDRARAQRLAVRQAQRGYEIASAQYREGMGSQLELTDAEVALRQSEFNYAEAVHEYLVARARLDAAVGELPAVAGT